MNKKYPVLGFVLVFVVFLSGCLSMSPETMAFANPLVKQFMSQYPNAQIQITHFTAVQSIPMLENISSECGKNVSAKEFYRITIDDPDSGLKVTAWIDWEEKKLECAVKYGIGDDKSISKPGEPIKTCKSHAEFRCYGQHVYWFDSCGHMQEKKEYCQEGCNLGFCKEKERKSCEEMGGYCVYPEVVPASTLTGMVTADQPLLATQDVFCGWSTYHICDINADCAAGGCSGQVCGGVNEDMTTTCEYKDCYNAEKFGAICGCYDGKCKWLEAQEAKPVCIDSDDGKNYHQKGYVFTGGSKMWDYCSDEVTLAEKYCTEQGQVGAVKVSCPEGGKCEDGACFGGMGETNEKEEVITDLVCTEGYAMAEYWCPNNGICCAPKEVKCEIHYQYKCYEGHVYWYDSCGNREEKKEYCEHGCEGGECKPACEKIVVTRTEGGSLGISPAKYEISFKPWKKIEFCGTVKNEMNDETTVILFDDGDLEEFGTLSTGNVHLDPLESAEFSYSMELPEELEPGEHMAVLYAADPAEAQETTQTAAQLKVGMHIIVNVPQSEEECRDESYPCTVEDIPCCAGLKEVPYGGYEPSTSQCIAATCGHVCRPCGNGICDENEDWCVCPEDCEPLCIDSDMGKNYYEKGTATKGEQSLSDHCNSDGTLTEKYCENNEIKAETVECPDGYECPNGACVLSNQTLSECVTSPCRIYAGETKSVMIEGDEYEVSLLGTSSHISGIISINDYPKEVEEGKYYHISGLEVRVEGVDYKNSSSVLVAIGDSPGISVIGEYATLIHGVYLSTNERGLFVGDNLDSARYQLTSEDLPDLLESGFFKDYEANEYPYTQYIILGSSKIHDNYIDIGSLASQPVYTSKIVFTDPLDFSNPDVNSITEDMKLFGRNYIVLPDSTNDAVELFESYHSLNVNGDENTTITFEGDDFKFEMLGYTDTEAVLRINGNDVIWEEGKTYTLPGSTARVHVSDVTTVYYGATESVHAVFMHLGRPVSLKNNEQVEVNYEDVSGTLVGIGKTGGKVSSISVSVAGQDSDKIYSGEVYEDPVWDSFELAFVHPTTLKSSIEIILEKA